MRHASSGLPFYSALALASVPTVWAIVHIVGLNLERAHRREFLEALDITPTETSLASDSAVEATVRIHVLSEVPLGSDSTAIIRYARRVGALPHVRSFSEHMSLGDGPPEHIGIWIPERSRPYEIGVCEWSRLVDFTLDSAAVVRGVAATRIGTCL